MINMGKELLVGFLWFTYTHKSFLKDLNRDNFLDSTEINSDVCEVEQ